MVLSEKASAFSIDNLISKSDKKAKLARTQSRNGAVASESNNAADFSCSSSSASSHSPYRRKSDRSPEQCFSPSRESSKPSSSSAKMALKTGNFKAQLSPKKTTPYKISYNENGGGGGDESMRNNSNHHNNYSSSSSISGSSASCSSQPSPSLPSPSAHPVSPAEYSYAAKCNTSNKRKNSSNEPFDHRARNIHHSNNSDEEESVHKYKDCMGQLHADSEDEFGDDCSFNDHHHQNHAEQSKSQKQKIAKPSQQQQQPQQFENFDQDRYSLTKANVEVCKGDSDMEEIECFLESDDLWKRFHELGTEMIITKSGRFVFQDLARPS